MWDAVTALGFTGGQVLEPGCGSGNFLHHAPAGASVIAVEQEPVTARVAAALHPQVTVRCESFADTPLPDGSVDLVIGNVPFGAVTLHDHRHNQSNLSIHNHFVLKSLHLCRPGGLVAVLTSRYTLDARNPAARREMAELADLVGAIRLPTGALARAAGTDAVADLLILRRRGDGERRRGPEFTETGPVVYSEQPAVRVNTYLLERPARVLGEFTLRHGAYNAQSLQVTPRPGELRDQLTAALDELVADAEAPATHHPGTSARSAAPSAPAPGPATLQASEGRLQISHDGGVTRVHAGRGRGP